MVSKLSFYDILSYLMPGAILVWALSLIQTDLSISVFPSQGNVMDVTLFLILAYFLGHLLQAFGRNIDDYLTNRWGGLPSVRFLKTGDGHYTEEFKESLKARGKEFFKIEGDLESERNIQEFFNLCYSFIEDHKISDKPFLFNSVYTFYRAMIAVSALNFILFGGMAIYLVLHVGWEKAYLYFALSLFFLVSIRIAINKFKERSENFADSVYRSFYAHIIKRS